MSESIINPLLSLDWLRDNATGKGVQVAVIDSGIDPNHPKLQGKIHRSCEIKDLGHKIAVKEIPSRESSDSYGHGTSIAGIISDIAPDAQIINIRVLNEYNACNGETLIEGIRWALDQKIKLINMSLATIREKYRTKLFELCEQAYEQDAILIVSKANIGPAGWPAMFSSVISVSLGDLGDRFDLLYNNSSLIECDAYGDKVKTATLGGGYSIQSGTSVATAHITGMVTLMLECFPNLLAVEAKALLKGFSI